MSEEVRRGPGRPPNARAEEVKVQRRRRDDAGVPSGLKLHVREESKDSEFTYRWIANDPGRVKQLTEMDDWDIAPPTTDGDKEGTVESRVVDKSDGRRHILVRKRKEFYNADKAKEMAVLDAQDEAMRRGPLNSSEGLGRADNAYVPGGKNIVGGR